MDSQSDSRSIQLSVDPASLDAEMFDPASDPELFDGVTIRRISAYMIDLAVIALLLLFTMSSFWILGMLSFGVLSPFLMAIIPFVPLAYHTFLIGGPARATLGMRLFGIEVRRMDGGNMDYLQACLLTVVFYVSVGLTGWLILLVALFNGRGRTFHDYLCGTLTVRTPLPIEGIAPNS